jgi:hypothetical protein
LKVWLYWVKARLPAMTAASVWAEVATAEELLSVRGACVGGHEAAGHGDGGEGFAEAGEVGDAGGIDGEEELWAIWLEASQRSVRCRCRRPR